MFWQKCNKKYKWTYEAWVFTRNKLNSFTIWFNRCPFQLIRSYKRHEENRSKIGQECSSDYQCHQPNPWMQESVSMHKNPTPVRHSRMNQARSEEEEEKERQIDRGQEADGKKGSPTKQKPIWGTKTSEDQPTNT